MNRVKPALYAFRELDRGRCRGYFFQLVTNRRLSPVYHTHDFYELLLILQGDCVQRLGDEETVCRTNDIILLRPGDSHAVLRQSPDVTVVGLSVAAAEFEQMCCVYEPTLATELRERAGVVRFTYPALREWLALCISPTPEHPTEQACKLCLSLVLKWYVDSREPDRRALPACLRTALGEMTRPEDLAAGIPRLVELSGYSRSHLSRLVRQHLGTTLHAYLQELRLTAAYRALSLSAESVASIGESLGYTSLSHFNKIFKERYGVSPTALRRQQGLWTI